MNSSIRMILLAIIAIPRVGQSSITATVDKLDPSDGVPVPPPSMLIVDLSVDASDDDAFAGIGINAVTQNGAEFIYAYGNDPNEPNGGVLGSAPGAENRFVTFFSRPRPRDADGRFGPGAYVTTGSRYCGGASPLFVATQLNAVGMPLGYEQGRDGYILRIALDLSEVVDPAFQLDSDSIVVSTSPVSGAVTLLETSCGEFDHGVQVAGRSVNSVYFGFGIYGIPEPSAAVGILFIAGWLLRRR